MDINNRLQVWRPTLDDVQRISQGDAARSRGTGSRAVPHRLNAEERKQYDLAKQKGVLTLAGSGYRRERECGQPCRMPQGAHWPLQIVWAPLVPFRRAPNKPLLAARPVCLACRQGQPAGQHLAAVVRAKPLLDACNMARAAGTKSASPRHTPPGSAPLRTGYGSARPGIQSEVPVPQPAQRALPLRPLATPPAGATPRRCRACCWPRGPAPPAGTPCL